MNIANSFLKDLKDNPINSIGSKIKNIQQVCPRQTCFRVLKLKMF